MLVISGISLAIVAMATGVGTMTIQHRRLTNDVIRSVQSYYTAESGIEDALLRVIDGAIQPNTYPPSPAIVTLSTSVGGASATTTISQIDEIYDIQSSGNKENRYRKIALTISRSGTSGHFGYGMQTGQGGIKIGNNAIVNGNVYSNGEIIGSNGATMNGQVVVAGGLDPTPNLSKTTYNADQSFATANATRDIAQSFIAPSNGPLNWVSVYLGKVGTPPSSSIALHIAEDNAGQPADSVSITETIPANIVSTTPSFIRIAFANPLTLVQNNKYWIILDTDDQSASNYWIWKKYTPDNYADNVGLISSRCCFNGASWSTLTPAGDLDFQLWIGGTMHRLKDVTVGNASTGLATANVFIGSTVHGSSCLNPECKIDNPDEVPLPIDDETIQSFRDVATGGADCVEPTCDADGNYVLGINESGTLNNVHIAGNLTLGNGATLTTTGPVRVTGNLTIDNGATLIMGGTIWVEGDITLINGCNIHLDSSYGQASGVIISDGEINVNPNCILSGSGDSRSFLLLLTDKEEYNPGFDTNLDVMTIDNNAVGVIYYASKGVLHLNENAFAKNATGHAINMDNRAVVTYDMNLANMFFWSGGSGSYGWHISSWQEVE